MVFPELFVQYPLLAHIKEVATLHQLQVRVVGGFVRDLLLGRASKDIDVVCLGDPWILVRALQQRLEVAHVQLFKHFGTAMLEADGYRIEFVGARKESYQRHSRNPQVSTGTFEDDERRRDFTINALSVSLNAEDFGTLHDPFGGVQDLQAKRLRTPLDPAIVFSDDPLRMLRAVRFATTLSLQLDADTHAAIGQQAHRIDIVSKERIATELHKIIASPEPVRGFELLDQTGLLGRVFPQLVALKGVSVVQGKSHKDNFVHTLQVLEGVAQASDNLWLRWAALLHDIAKPATKRFDPKVGFTFHGHEELGARMVPRIFRKMRLPLNHRMRYVQKLVRLHLRPIALVQQVTDAALRRLLYEAGEDLEDLMVLCRADITSKNDRRVARYLANFAAVEAKLKELAARDQVRKLQPVVDGNMIMKTFQLRPSAQVGVLKKRLKDAILDGVVPNEMEPLYAYMLEVAREYGLMPAPQPVAA